MIVDSFVFSDLSLVQSNLIAIVKQITAITPKAYNLTIITYEGDKVKLNGNELLESLKESNLNAHVSIVLLSRIKKEHDRTIVMNYLRLKSGDSFNYYDSKNKLITNGTELELYPFTIYTNQRNSDNIMKELSEKITAFSPHEREKYVFGTINNRLLCLK